MIVTCSNCRARYAVDPLAIGPTGRTVECARCHHRWFQRAEGPPPTPDIDIFFGENELPELEVELLDGAAEDEAESQEAG